MKKVLLLSSAFCLSLGAFAQKTVAVDAVANVRADQPVDAVQAAVRADNGADKFFDENAAAPVMKADATVLPYYVNPGCTFFPSYLTAPGYTGNTLLNVDRFYVPSGAPVVWHNGVQPDAQQAAANWEALEFFVNEENQMDARKISQTGGNLTATYPFGYILKDGNAPIISVSDKQYQVAGQMHTGGVMMANFGDPIGSCQMAFSPINHDGIKKFSEVEALTDPYQVVYFNYNNYRLNAQQAYRNTKLIGFAEILHNDGATFGIQGVMAPMAILKLGETKTVNLDIYKFEGFDSKYGRPMVGERLGGGYLPASEYREGYWNYNIIPIIEKDGELETTTFLNIDCDVMVVISGFAPDADGYAKPLCAYSLWDAANKVAVPGPVAANEAIGYNFLEIFNTDDEGNMTTSKNQAIFETVCDGVWNGDASTISFDFAYVGFNSTLAAEGVKYEFNAPVGGGSMTFDFEPYDDIAEAGKFTGEGMYEWIFATAGEVDPETYVQKVTVEVDALPAGEKGRAGQCVVEICGAKQVITVIQGEVNGIADITVDNEADVKAVAGDFIVNGEGAVNVYTVDGKLVRTGVAAGETVIPASDLAAGLYIVKVADRSAKVIK